MYLDYYGLHREPFHITPDPYFFYLSPSHKEAFASMIYGLKNRKGFMAITGEVGLGKTTVLRTFLEQWAKKRKVKTVFIFNTDISFKGLLKIILEELGVEHPFLPEQEGKHEWVQGDREEVFELVQVLHKALIKEYQDGQNVILIIDEAQNMPLKTLESLRMLSNLETAKDKLLQIFLIGQPELDEKLKRNELRQLRQRIAIRAALKPLSKHESYEYIKSRLKKSGALASTIFSSRALKKIYSFSRGIPRNINILCDNALVTGFGAGRKKINPRIVKEVQADLQGENLRLASWKWGYACALSLLLLSVLGWFSPYRQPVLSAVRNQPVFVSVYDSVSSFDLPFLTTKAVKSTANDDDSSKQAAIPDPSKQATGAAATEDLKDGEFPAKTQTNETAPDAKPLLPGHIPGEPVFIKQDTPVPESHHLPLKVAKASKGPDAQNINPVSEEESPGPSTRSSSPLNLPDQNQTEVVRNDLPNMNPNTASHLPAADPSAQGTKIGIAKTTGDEASENENLENTLYSRLSDQKKSTYSTLEEKIPVFSALSPTRQKVLLAMAEQISVNGLMTFEKMLSALEEKDFVEAARQMRFSRWRARVKEEADQLAKIMRTGKQAEKILSMNED
ncbi:MAG: AAA family ATPase [Desulfohalobiaceae bacterium]|nr:AAA family ATPase [Desulfohalobiaceae bacterium]